MTAVAPYRSEVTGTRDGFAQLLRAEWTKFRTVRGWMITLLVTVLVMVGFGLLSAASWARWATIVIATLNILEILGFVGSATYPLWALTALTLNLIVLYAVTVRWGEGSETIRTMAESRY